MTGMPKRIEMMTSLLFKVDSSLTIEKCDVPIWKCHIFELLLHKK